MKSFILILSFFTRIPVGHLVDYTDERYRKAIKWFPYIGLIMGSILIIPRAFIPVERVAIANLLTLLFYLLISGGIHLDGFSDTLDGFLSNQPKERIFEIMKDSRVGAFGAIGLVFYMLSFYVSLSYVSLMTLLLMPYIGKFCASFYTGFTQYARPTRGMGSILLEENSPLSSLIHFVIMVGITYGLTGIRGSLAAGLTLLMVGLFYKWCLNKIGGMTGDTIGFLVECAQLLFLLISGLII